MGDAAVLDFVNLPPVRLRFGFDDDDLATLAEWVDTANTRSPPSSCALETRYTIGYVGHGWVAGRVVGGVGRISSCVTDAAP